MQQPRIRKTTHRTAVVLAGTAVAVLNLAACGTSGTAKGGTASHERFTLMIQGTGDASQVVEHHAVMLLKQQGIDASVKYEPGATPIAIAQVRSGAVDAYSVSLNGGLSAVAAGIPLVDFALEEPRQDYVFLARKGINTLQDLKGKNIGVQDTTGANYAQAILVLDKAGLSVKDVSIVAAGGQSTRLAALVSGRVDATMLSHAAEIKLGGKGYTALFDYTKQASSLYDDNCWALKSWLSAHQSTAVAYNKALLASYKWFDDPANAGAVVDEALTIDPQADKAQISTLFDLLRNDDMYPQGTILDLTKLDQQQQLFKQAGALTKTVPVSQWADDSFAKQALAGS